MADIILFTKQHLRIIMAITLLMVFFAFGIILYRHSATHDYARAAAPRYLNFQSITISSKDTLWGIAKQYYSEEYGSFHDYINEIKRCNSLTNDAIYAGSSLIVPIYTAPK